MNNRHPQQLKKSKPFSSYLQNSTANPAHLPQKWAKWAELAVQFSWQVQNGTKDFNFFNCHGRQTFILAEIHCYLSPHIFWTYQFIPKWCERGKRIRHVGLLFLIYSFIMFTYFHIQTLYGLKVRRQTFRTKMTSIKLSSEQEFFLALF